MSEHVTLTLRAALEESIDLECIVPDRLAALSAAEISALPVMAGRKQRPLGDWFEVRGDRSPHVRVVGDVRRATGIGCGMTNGELTIDGAAGAHTGAGMSGGRLDVHGTAGDDVGVGMAGGSIRVRGSAGNRVGAALAGASRGMTGGEIMVDGSVGADAGARMRRGMLFVGGDAGERAGRSIIAGTIIVLGRVGPEPATGSKRGSLIAGGGLEVPVTYRYACRYHPPHVRLALTSLVRRHGVQVDQRFLDGAYRRYCGDAATIARGEILEWNPE